MAHHAFGIMATLANPISMESVSRMLGNSSFLMTKTYARFLDSSIEEKMNGLKYIFLKSIPNNRITPCIYKVLFYTFTNNI